MFVTMENAVKVTDTTGASVDSNEVIMTVDSALTASISSIYCLLGDSKFRPDRNNKQQSSKQYRPKPDNQPSCCACVISNSFYDGWLNRDNSFITKSN